MSDANNFIYALEERIGNPELFVGRKKEMKYVHKWLNEHRKKYYYVKKERLIL